MTPYQIILFMLKMLAQIREEYPADLLAARRAWFKEQIAKHTATGVNKTCSTGMEQVRS